MSLELEVQVALASPGLPEEAVLRRWAEAALAGRREEAELVVRIVGEAEGAALNQAYRHKQGATNVLAFPFEAPAGIDTTLLLGDVVICAPVVVREALAQGKAVEAHWAHIVVHGVLHLLGYDHQTDSQAAAMEALEVRILAGLGYPNPYGDLNES